MVTQFQCTERSDLRNLRGASLLRSTGRFLSGLLGLRLYDNGVSTCEQTFYESADHEDTDRDA